jgi:hypothetical protein
MVCMDDTDLQPVTADRDNWTSTTPSEAGLALFGSIESPDGGVTVR